MAPPVQAKYQTALNVTFTGTPTLALFQKDDFIYLEPEYVQGSGKNLNFVYAPYKAGNVIWKMVAGEIEDKDGNPADGSGGDTQFPYWYELIPSSTNPNASKIGDSVQHESDCKTLAQIDTIIGAQVGNWTNV